MVERNDQWEHYFQSLEEDLEEILMVEGRNEEGEVMTPKTHVLDELKKHAVFALCYLDKALELNFKNLFRKWCFKAYFTSKRLLRKYYRGKQPMSHRGRTRKLLLDLETGVILGIALYKDMLEVQSKK
jgi:hypothetical protein